MVVAIKGDMAVLETGRTNACSSCGAAASCGTSVLGTLFGQKQNLIEIQNSFDARPGEKIVLGLPENDLVLASLAAYLLPLLAMIILPLLALSAGFGDPAAAFLALVGLAGGLRLAGHLTHNAKGRFTPIYLRRATPPLSLSSGACAK